VHQIEWSMRSGRAWARGPGHNALPDMRTNDEVARSTLTGIQFDAEPMWWAADEDVLTLADIVPGNVLYGDSRPTASRRRRSSSAPSRCAAAAAAERSAQPDPPRLPLRAVAGAGGAAADDGRGSAGLYTPTN
jgi:hypothetical protein